MEELEEGEVDLEKAKHQKRAKSPRTKELGPLTAEMRRL